MHNLNFMYYYLNAFSCSGSSFHNKLWTSLSNAHMFFLLLKQKNNYLAFNMHLELPDQILNGDVQ